MSEIVMNAAQMMEMLPDSEKNFAYEFIKKLVLAWDPDFTKVTPEEAAQIKEAEESGYVNESEIDWNNLSNMFA
ncbi:MAG: hypothetical protein IJC09_06290 [Clostridia bacterium]|nr:hypothetical protein [Clostridia bacterium]